MDNLRDSILQYSLIDDEIEDKETLYTMNPQDPTQQPFSPYYPNPPVTPQPFSP